MLLTSCYGVQKGPNSSSLSDKQWVCSYICPHFALKTSPKRTSLWYIYFTLEDIGVSGETCSIGNSRVWKSPLFKTNYFHGQWCSKYLWQASKKQKSSGDSEVEKNNTRWVCSFTYMCPACMCVHVHAQSLEIIISILAVKETWQPCSTSNFLGDRT